MYLVIDIGGTFIKYAVMDESASIIKKDKKASSASNLIDFKTLIFSIIEEQDLNTIKGIAISCPGIIDINNGIIYHGGSFPFLHEVNLIREIESKYGINASIENDAKCAALAELWLGNVKNASDSVVLILGTGVGGGVIIDGKIYRGVNLSAGEFSYCTTNINPKTKIGRYFGYDCSAVEMIRRIALIKKLDNLTDGEAVFRFIMENDEEANVIFNEYCINLATKIYNLQYILDPELFAIGGGISAQPILFDRIQWALTEIKKENPMHIANPNIIACKFRNDANLYGALYHFFVRKEQDLI